MENITESIIERIKNKDEEAFRTLFYAYKTKIFYMACKATRNVHDAEDCVQEVFIKILKQIPEYNNSLACFNTWVIMITKNCIIDFMKTKQQLKEKCVLNPFLIYCRGVQNNYDNEILLSEIEKYIGEKRYQILTLKRTLNLTFDEIGKTLSMNPSNVRKLYNEAYVMARDYVYGKEREINEKRKN